MSPIQRDKIVTSRSSSFFSFSFSPSSHSPPLLQYSSFLPSFLSSIHFSKIGPKQEVLRYSYYFVGLNQRGILSPNLHFLITCQLGCNDLFFQVRYSHISSSGLSSHVPGTLLSALYIYSYNLLNNYEMGIMPIPHFIVWKTEGGRKGCVESHMVKLHSQELNPTAWLLA